MTRTLQQLEPMWSQFIETSSCFTMYDILHLVCLCFPFSRKKGFDWTRLFFQSYLCLGISAISPVINISKVKLLYLRFDFKTIMHMFSSPLTRSCPYKRKAFFVVQVLFWQQPLWKDSLQITYYWNQHSCQLPVSLLAQLVEHWTGIAEVMDSNPVTMYKLEFFFPGLLFTTA